MIDISVTADLKAAAKRLTAIQKTAVVKAAQHAINRTAQQAERTALQSVSKTMGLAQKRVKRGVVRTKASRSRLIATIKATGRRLNIFGFSGRVLKRGGVTAAPWKKRRRFNKVFTIPGRFTGKQVAVLRQGSDKLRSAYGPGIASEFKAALPAIRRTISQRWPINFSADLKFYLSKLK